MDNAWIDSEAEEFLRSQRQTGGAEVALLAYATRLVGGQPDLAMHGGGNTSLKGTHTTLAGDEKAALFVKASGVDMERITPAGFVCLDLGYLRKLRSLPALADSVMADEFRTHLLRPSDRLPSIETLMHAFLAPPAVVHTHPTAILALTNRVGAEEALAEALGDTVGVVPYAGSGLSLGRAVADELERRTGCRAVVVMQHGLVTCGASPQEAYDATVETVSRAEAYLARRRGPAASRTPGDGTETARRRYREIAPLIRGLLSPPSGNPDTPRCAMILAPLISPEVLALLASPGAKTLADTVPLTPDYLVRTRSWPLLVEQPDYEDPDGLRRQLAAAIDAFGRRYGRYVQRHASRLPEFVPSGLDMLPRVLFLPGLGAVCAGPDAAGAAICRDITGQTLTVKATIGETGGQYQGLTEEHLFDMEFRAYQRAKVAAGKPAPLRGRVAIVTGAAGAIGSGICEGLLRQGCHVAATDLAGASLDSLTLRLRSLHRERLVGMPLDVTDGASVSAAFDRTVEAFGGIDIVVINAGLAHVSPLVTMDIEAFRRLERVNVEGTLLLLAEAGRLFTGQNTGGDIVLVSTKNVFAPGPQFGAYSATKAASHQLCRIASIEFAPLGVRVNMVAPDAVFSHGATKSGLWAQVGPDRMKARGLDEQGLEEYYRQRNLLKARVTAEHVAAAVLFFVTRQTPTTGATIPVDGGLPDAAPR
ncbi:MAG: bifunctional aldolase/short-chain dehydrogenase [Syntrophales bacterium]